MNLEYNEMELHELMKDFYVLTGIRIVLFDLDYNELLSYPEHNCAFCSQMKSQEHTIVLCSQSDRTSFQKCKETNRLVIFHCHAGLIEATAPLIENNTVIGYMMFGQISDEQNVEMLASMLAQYFSLSPNVKEDILRYTEDIPLKTREQIQAAAKIMEACAFYAILKNTITIQRNNFIRNMDAYLLANLSEDLSIDALSSAFGISKTKLCQSATHYYGCGIAEHIRHLRIEKAKTLLKETDKPITRISDLVGFADYNYFCRVFKREVGLPAKKYRKSTQ